MLIVDLSWHSGGHVVTVFPGGGLSKYAIGFVYVLSNGAMPGIVKVGMTTDLAEDRAKQLHATGVPLPFDVEFRTLTSRPHEVEKYAHELLEPFRVSPNRKFFEVSPDMAIDTVRDALLEVAGIDAWDADEPHHVRSGDRIALTASAGDLFVVMALPHLTARRVEPIDFWQAHSDGDLLELMGTRDEEAVAGFSDGDPDGVVDPVPHLDRGRNSPNGVINGRERLVPGDRLLWLTPMAGGEVCKIAMFEMRDHCQAVSRTWDGKLDPDGHPLLLNTPTYEKPPPGVVRVTQLVMRMPPPRSWAPRPRTSS
ncbi:GIY-YIG nuclease family protein [Planomonospora sp. ID82291]|uniref:GIY-YIG nuclease family protein n=1 Tax=Planomonospora sp. ID82291 TaxID=2738136 RepID=UPI0018C38B3C|nr:GIY-YIG nuclease family protein [Planomonospora sp. ID82291]MBG0815572.1 GIY-YIG nuclease family protein [Planomonospora sp. ID82291]